jgi:acyl-CoA synthetase (AMP-forming)/AMP-acid ligase II
MIDDHLRAGLSQHGHRLALVEGPERRTFAELAEEAERLAERWPHLAGRRVALACGRALTVITAGLALDRLGAHAFLAGPREDADLARWAEAFGWRAIVRDEPAGVELRPPAGEAVGHPRVTILTSGTTGLPKAVNHTWSSLASPVRVDPRYAGTRWLCAYPLTLYAGTQVLLQALLNWATLVVPAERTPVEIARTLTEERVQYASGTPTFWRQLLVFGPREVLRGARLEQITMGGEPAPADLLERLRELFPEARIVHIYASTELGRLFSVTDGREGFPAAYLDRCPEPGVELRVEEGQLMARSRHAMLGYEGSPAEPPGAGDWIATGDRVERRGERIVFLGRTTDLVNVGGHKVWPADVEAVLRAVPGVAEVRVYGKRSSLTGQVLVADLVAAPGVPPDQVRQAAGRHAREHLPEPQVPRILRLVERIETSDAFKLSRRTEEDRR